MLHRTYVDLFSSSIFEARETANGVGVFFKKKLKESSSI
jgi:hypothetical protein